MHRRLLMASSVSSKAACAFFSWAAVNCPFLSSLSATTASNCDWSAFSAWTASLVDGFWSDPCGRVLAPFLAPFLDALLVRDVFIAAPLSSLTVAGRGAAGVPRTSDRHG